MNIKFEKGHWIYLSSFVIIISMMFFQNSCILFSLKLASLNVGIKDILPDLIGLITLIGTYFVLKIFYKRRSRFRKRYIYYVLLIGLIWTIGVQIK